MVFFFELGSAFTFNSFLTDGSFFTEGSFLTEGSCLTLASFLITGLGAFLGLTSVWVALIDPEVAFASKCEDVGFDRYDSDDEALRLAVCLGRGLETSAAGEFC